MDAPWIHLKQQKLGTIRVELSMKDLMRPGILGDINIGHCLAAKRVGHSWVAKHETERHLLVRYSADFLQRAFSVKPFMGD
jgi:hypothetical protein